MMDSSGATTTTTTIDGFDKSLEELIHFGDSLKSREKELEQRHAKRLEKQKTEFDTQLQIEKKRIEQLETINRTLSEQITEAADKQIGCEEDYTVALNTNYNCSSGESKQIKEKYNESNLQIQQFENDISLLKADQVKLNTEIIHLKLVKQTLLNKINETPSQAIPGEDLDVAEKAINENHELKKMLIERDKEIVQLNERINKTSSDESQRLLELLIKLKDDFQMMYEIQSKFFSQQIDHLKQEQRDNVPKLSRPSF